MKKHLTLIASMLLLVAGLLMLDRAAKADFLFWLDSPSKSNNHKSAEAYKTVVAILSAGMTATYTDTKTVTPTFSYTQTQTPPVGSTNTFTSTITETPTTPAGNTSTFTSTITPSATNTTVIVAGWNGEIYGCGAGKTYCGEIRGENVTAAFSFTPTPAAGITEVVGGGQSGANAMEITVTARNYFGAGVMAFGFSAPNTPITHDASGYTTLEFKFMVPSTGGNGFYPDVRLFADHAGTEVLSKKVYVADYLPAIATPNYGQFIVADQWYTAEIPLSAFEGTYTEEGVTSTFAPGDLATVKGVKVMPTSNNFARITFDLSQDPGKGQTVFSGAIFVECVKFTNAAANAVPVGAGAFSDGSFANGCNAWGGYAFWYSDRCKTADPTTGVCIQQWGTCTNYTTTHTYPAAPMYQAWPPIASPYAGPVVGGAGDGCPATPAASYHMSGLLGGDNSDCSDYSYCGLGLNLSDPKGNVDLTTKPFTQLSFKFKLGAGSGSGQEYCVVFPQSSLADTGKEFYYSIPAPTASWQTYTIRFIASGGNPISMAMPGWATAEPWDPTTISSIKFEPRTRTVNFDYYVDDIQFLP